MRAKGEKKTRYFASKQRFSISRTLRLHTNDSKGAPYETHVAKASVSQHLRAFYVAFAVEEFKFH